MPWPGSARQSDDRAGWRVPLGLGDCFRVGASVVPRLSSGGSGWRRSRSSEPRLFRRVCRRLARGQLHDNKSRKPAIRQLTDGSCATSAWRRRGRRRYRTDGDDAGTPNETTAGRVRFPQRAADLKGEVCARELGASCGPRHPSRLTKRKAWHHLPGPQCPRPTCLSISLRLTPRRRACCSRTRHSRPRLVRT
jgi:hypothetical protein